MKLTPTPPDTPPIIDKGDGLPWNDTDLLQDVVRPALEVTKVYREGLGFHSLRRKAITELQAKGASSIEAARFAGHAKTSMQCWSASGWKSWRGRDGCSDFIFARCVDFACVIVASSL